MHRVFISLFALTLVACGGSPTPPAETPSTSDAAPAPRKEKALQMDAEIGTLDERQVRSTFEALWNGALDKCRKDANEFVSGSVVIKLRVDKQGKAKWAYMPQSELGDHVVEKCMLEAVSKASWPQPEGGENGLAEQQLTFPERADRPPVDWPSDKAAPTISRAQKRLDACRSDGSGPFHVTILVQTDGSVMSVGIAQPNEETADAAACMAEVIKSLTFPTTGSWPARVSLAL